MGLRGRLILAFLLAALLPMATVGLWARNVIADLAEAEHERRTASTVVAARHRIESRIRADEGALAQLCARDYALRRLGREVLAGDGGTFPGRDVWDAQAAELRRTVGLDAIAIRVRGAPERPPGTLLAADPGPLRKAGPDPALVQAAGEADGAFVVSVDVPGEGRTRALVASCEVNGEAGSLTVLGARVLDASYVRSVLGDVTPVGLHEAGNGASLGEGQHRVHTLEDATGRPVVHIVADVGGDPLAADIARLDRGFVITAAVAVLLASLLGVLLALATTRPLRSLEQAARRVGEGDLESTVGGSHAGEVGDALEAFNRMTRELKRTRAKLLRAERIAAWRDIARRIAHEIKNPLSPIQMSIETMRKTYAKRHPDFDEIFEESTEAILEEVDRLKKIVGEFSQFARMPRPDAAPLDVREVVERVVGLHREGDVALRWSAAEVPEVRADREQLTQVLSNLVLNAIEAARSRHGERGGEVRVTVQHGPEGRGVRITVEDNGPGIPEQERDRIFDPYYTTKEGGTGLGLAIVHRIVTDHGGEIDVQEGPGKQGTRFQIDLPPEGPPPEAEASLTESPVPLVTQRSRTP